MIVNSFVLNTKKNFFLLFDDNLPVFESFQVSPKILIFEISYFLSKKIFFSKKWMLQVLENFMGYSNQKAEKKNLSRSGGISILVKCFKKTEKSKYLSKYWVSWPDIRLDRKRIKSYPSLRYIISCRGQSAGHVIPFIGDQKNIFYSPECLRKVSGTKLK